MIRLTVTTMLLVSTTPNAEIKAEDHPSYKDYLTTVSESVTNYCDKQSAVFCIAVFERARAIIGDGKFRTPHSLWILVGANVGFI
jgi:hypothetical protein